MRYVKLFITGILLLIITSLFTDEISVYQITPCLLLPWVIYISINLDYKSCLSFTFILGMANDLLNPQLLGFNTILLVLISHFSYRYNNSFNKDKYYTVILSLFIINFFFYFIQWAYFSVSSVNAGYLFMKTIFTIFYNTIISCVLIVILYIIDKLRITIYG